MKKNIGSVDRTIRTVLAPVLGVVGLVVGPGGGLALAMYALATMLMATAAASRCPLYLPFGLSTRSKAVTGR